MLRDAKITSIAERMRRLPLGGDTVLRRQRRRGRCRRPEAGDASFRRWRWSLRRAAWFIQLGEAGSSFLIHALCTPCVVNDSWRYRSLLLDGCSTTFWDVARHCPRSLHRSSCTITSTARHLSSAALSSPRHRDGKSKHRVILTVKFPE